MLRKIESALAWLSRYGIGKNFSEYCDLRTVIGLTADDAVRHPNLTAPYIHVTKNNDYVSAFEIKGAFREFNFEEVSDGLPVKGSYQFFISRLAESLTGDFRHLGHKLSFVCEHDPDRGEEEMTRLLQPLRQSWTKLHLAMDDLADEKIKKMTPYIARERGYLIVYTALLSLPSDEIKHEIKRQNAVAAAANMPTTKLAQNPLYAEFEGLKLRHDAFIDKLASDMNDSNDGVLVRLLDAHETGQIIRDEIEKSSTSADWQPLLPGDRVMPHGKIRDNDISACLAPHLNYQYCNTELKTSGNTIFCDGFYHGQLAVNLYPQNPKHFKELFASMPRQLPWRIRFDLMPNGVKQLGNKNILLSFLAVFPALRRQYDSVQWLMEKNKTDPVVVLTVTASTWHRDEKTMQRNYTLLKKSLQGWGICDVTGIFGDPVRAWVSSLPAVSSYSGPNMLFAPLTDALRLLPLQQACSPWQQGNVIYMTTERKPFPVKLASDIQIKHTELVMGPPGSGKSVLANGLHLAFLANGNVDLPFMLLIDKGFTAMGFFEMVKNSLPDEEKHKIISIVLTNTAKHCRNIMDIQLGLSAPLSTERSFIINLLKSICADPETGLPPDPTSCADILGRIVDMAYKEKSEVNPTRYDPGLVENVDLALERTGIRASQDDKWWDTATWYEVRDLLFDHRCISEATLAQSQAVPVINDLQNELNRKELISIFEKVTRPGTGEPLLGYISRCLTRALTDYPVLSGRTKLMISPETRIAVIDLNEVMGGATKEGRLKTGIMYQFARQIGGGNDFYLPQVQDELYKALPPSYLPLHRRRIEQLDQEVKTIFIDEMHNIKGVQVLWDAMQVEDREQRKFGVRTVFSSQYPDDFPAEILESANTAYILRIAPRHIEMLRDVYQVPDVTLNRLIKTPNGAAPDGSGITFLAVYRTTEGTVVQLLKHAPGAMELWALNSNVEDRALRNELTKTLGSKATRELLAKTFPQGSARRHIAWLKEQDNDADAESAAKRLASQLLLQYGYLQN